MSNLMFSSILALGFLLCTLALLYSECFYSVSEVIYMELNSYIESEIVHDSIITGLAVSLPMLIELCYDKFVCRGHVNSGDFWARLIVLFFLFFPNAAVLLIIVPMGGPVAFGYLQYVTSIFYMWSSFYYLYEYGGAPLKKKSTVILTLIYTIAASCGYWNLLYPQLYYVSLTKTILYPISSIFIFKLTFSWIYYFKKIGKSRTITFHEKCCNIYISAIICTGFLSWVIYIIKLRGGPDLTYSYQNYLLSCLAVLINIIHGRIAKRESELSQQALDIKRMFVRYVSHEIRNPLNTVFLGLKILKKEINKIDFSDFKNNIMETFNDIQSSCDISLQILNDLLMFDKIESGILVLERVEVDVRAMVTESVHAFEMQAMDSNIHLSCTFQDIDDETHLLCLLDPHRMKQVLRNILSNALKFTPPRGSIAVTVSLIENPPTYERLHLNPITHSSSQSMRYFGKHHQRVYSEEEAIQDVTDTKKTLAITVTDTGPGISEENQSKLFKSIIQFSPGTLQSGQGTGLGLYISNGIMRLHGGNITVVSEGTHGSGSAFTVSLPFVNSIETTTRCGTGNQSTPSSISGRLAECLNSKYISTSKNRSKRLSILHEEMQNKLVDTKVLLPSVLTVTPFQQINDNDSRITYHLTEQHVLIVDDVALNRKMLARLLVGKVQSVAEAEDGEIAVQYFLNAETRGKEIDIIFMDYQMPRLDGPSAASKLRELGYKGLIIGVTGNAVQKDMETFVQKGANFVMTKPLDFDSLELKLISITAFDH